MNIKEYGPKSRRQSGPAGCAILKRLLPALLGIGGITVASDPCLGAQGLHVVPSPFINNSALFGTAAIADSDIWAVGDIVSGNTAQTLAEHFNGTSWNVVPTPAVQGGEFAAVDGVASNDVWAV